MLYPQGASATRYAAPVVPLPTVAVNVTIRSATMQRYCCKYKLYNQLHWLPVAVVLLPDVFLPGVSEKRCAATSAPTPVALLPVAVVLLPVALLPVELLPCVTLLPPAGSSSFFQLYSKK
jgi:hypothetical protein